MTAYALFKNIFNQCNGKSPEESVKIFAQIISENLIKDGLVFDDKEEKQVLGSSFEKSSAIIQNIIEDFKAIFSSDDWCTEEDMKEIGESDINDILKPKIISAMCRSNEVILTKKLEYIIKVFLTLRNKAGYAAFPEEGSVPPLKDESTRIKAAISLLQKIEDADDVERKSQQIEQAMIATFWYPKIPNDRLIDLETLAGAKKWKEIMAKKRYNKNTKPRDNSEDGLLIAVVNHIKTIFSFCQAIDNPWDKRLTSTLLDYIEDGDVNPYYWALEDEDTFREKVFRQLKISGFVNDTASLSSDDTSRGSIVKLPFLPPISNRELSIKTCV